MTGTEIYISADIETDGPVPGRYSMLSFGLAAIATYNGEQIRRLDARAHAAYWELKPITESFDEDALRVNGLSRERLAKTGLSPDDAMRQAADWVEAIAGERRPVLVAYPVAFDWLFLHWYFETFAGRSPFGHGSCIDIRSLYVGASGVTFTKSSKSQIPASLQPHAAHTHHALDDAIEQGQLFLNILELARARRVDRCKDEALTPGSSGVP